jgi:hypothetical protein
MVPNDNEAKEDWEALGQQSEAVQRAAAALSAAMGRARAARLLIILTGMALVLVVCFKTYSLGMQVQSPEYLNALMVSGQKRLAENSDRYRGELDKLVDYAGPAVSKAFAEQAKKDLPAFLKKADKEKDALAADLQKEFGNRLTTHYQHLLAEQENTLKEEFPTIKEEATRQRMVKNLDKAVQKLLQKYYIEELHRKIDGLVYTWDHFPEADLPGPGEPPLPDQLIANLYQLLALSLASGVVPGR